MGLWGTWARSRERLSEMAFSMVMTPIQGEHFAVHPVVTARILLCVHDISSPTAHGPVQSGRQCTRPSTSFVSLGPHSAEFSEQTAVNAFFEC